MTYLTAIVITSATKKSKPKITIPEKVYDFLRPLLHSNKNMDTWISFFFWVSCFFECTGSVNIYHKWAEVLTNLILIFCAAITWLYVTSECTYIPKSFTYNTVIANQKIKRKREEEGLGHSRRGQQMAGITSEKIVSNKVKTHRSFHLLICITDKSILQLLTLVHFISKRKTIIKLVIFLAKTKEVKFQKTSIVPSQHKDLGINNWWFSFSLYRTLCLVYI